MGYFSDLDLKIREHGYDTGRLIDSLPPCSLCKGKQAIVDISDDGKSIGVRCVLGPCPRFSRTILSPERWLLPSPSDLGCPVVLEEPLSLAEIIRQYENGGRVEGVVAIEFQEFIGQTLDEIRDMLAEALVNGLLMDIRYHLVSCKEQVLYIHVNGNPESILADEAAQERRLAKLDEMR